MQPNLRLMCSTRACPRPKPRRQQRFDLTAQLRVRLREQGSAIRRRSLLRVEGNFDLMFHMLPDEGKPFNEWVINDKAWPNVDPLIVKAGKRYRGRASVRRVSRAKEDFRERPEVFTALPTHEETDVRRQRHLAICRTCPWRIRKSCCDRSLIQPSTMLLPTVRSEIYECSGPSNTGLWQSSLQPGMRSVAIIVMLEVDEF